MNDGSGMPNHGAQLLFLYPHLWHPLKTNFAKRFELLSEKYSGHIFTISGSRYRNLPISQFRFHAETAPFRKVSKHVTRFVAQTVLPLYLLWPRTRIDIVIAYDPYSSAFAGIILKWFFRSKLVVEVNGDYHTLITAESGLRKRIKKIVFQLAIHFCDAVKVLNRDQENFFKRVKPCKRIHRFGDFIPSSYFKSMKSYQGDYILSVGYPFDLKGMDILILAFKKISSTHEAIKLRIMGYCPEEELKKYKELAGGDVKIEFIEAGWVEDVGEQLRGCYALVNAARSEAMGRIHLEAMACGKAIVATRTNGAMECVEDGRTGMLCEIGNVDDLASKLDLLLSNPGLAMQMGLAGRKKLETEFSEEKYVDSFSQMIGEVGLR